MAKNPFDYVNSINSHKKLEDTEGYNAFIINRSLSYFSDTILLANELNMRGHMDADMQYEFLFNVVRPRKRFSKWAKPDNHDDLKLICDYYGYNMLKAKQALSVLTDDQVNEIRKRFDKGGVIKK